jgi:hypothetical protein
MQRITFRIVPTLIVVGLVGATLFGQSGLLDMWRLQAEANAVKAEWGDVERENSRRLLVLRHLDEDPINVERLLAEEYRWVPEDAHLYEFEEP